MYLLCIKILDDELRLELLTGIYENVSGECKLKKKNNYMVYFH